jgi:hypothetical protein
MHLKKTYAGTISVDCTKNSRYLSKLRIKLRINPRADRALSTRNPFTISYAFTKPGSSIIMKVAKSLIYTNVAGEP